MISKQMLDWGESGNSIREIAAYGERRAAEIGAENVYNFSIGSPSIDPPDCVHAAIERLLHTVPPTQLHAYAPAPGMASVREKVAAYLTQTFGEAYRELVYGGVEVPFLPAIYPNAIYCYSYSKTLSLPGERVGFLALHPAMDDYAAVHAAVLGAGRALGYICVSSLFQLAVAECLGKTADIAAYAENRELIYGALTAMGYRCVRPDGAFYLFLKSPEPDSRAFCRRAMDYDILLVPGDDFGCPGYARLAYCVARSQIERSLPAFRKLAGSYGLCK